jgi:anti-sigma B factor antagonist
MRIHEETDTLRIGGFRRLDAAQARALQGIVNDALGNQVKDIELDCSQLTLLDSYGLGVLIALRNKFDRRGGAVRLINPTATVRHILELTRLHRVLEIVECEESLVPVVTKPSWFEQRRSQTTRIKPDRSHLSEPLGALVQAHG